MSRLRIPGLNHVQFVRKDVDNLDRYNFAYYKSFPTVATKISPNCITYHQINGDVSVWYKQCIPRKLCTLVLRDSSAYDIFALCTACRS